MELIIECAFTLNKYRDFIPLRTLFRDIYPNDEIYTQNNKPSNKYMQLYRLIHRKTDWFVTKKMDGLLWVGGTLEIFDLISDEVKFKQSKNSIFSLPTRATPERRESIIRMMENKTLTPTNKKQIIKNFCSYIDFTKDLKICFKRTHPKLPYPVTLAIPYSTRFTTKTIKKRRLDNFDKSTEKSLQLFKEGVFLTLTSDPNQHKSLWHCNRNFAGAWNRFLSFLTKRIGTRPKYMVAFEYTKKTGLLHAHILFFGIKWLLPHREITKVWEHCGQGSVNWIYGITNTNNGWHWKRGRPTNCQEKTATDYLKKYLKKAMFSNTDQELFWCTNKRFNSSSRLFTIKADEKSYGAIQWKFIGSWNILSMPENIYLALDRTFHPKSGG